jgi:cation diffusion facilitator CzcD-associated flavoprotein CzcO
MAGALLPIKVPDIQLVIFDKNDDVGGTWHENVYAIYPRMLYDCSVINGPSDTRECVATYLHTYTSQASRQTLNGRKNMRLDLKFESMIPLANTRTGCKC